MPQDRVVLNRLFFYVFKELDDVYNQHLSEFGLNSSSFLALAMILSSEDNRLNPSHLSDALIASRTNVTRLADDLVGSGWVSRKPCTQDRRRGGTVADVVRTEIDPGRVASHLATDRAAMERFQPGRDHRVRPPAEEDAGRPAALQDGLMKRLLPGVFLLIAGCAELPHDLPARPTLTAPETATTLSAWLAGMPRCTMKPLLPLPANTCARMDCFRLLSAAVPSPRPISPRTCPIHSTGGARIGRRSRRRATSGRRHATKLKPFARHWRQRTPIRILPGPMSRRAWQLPAH